MLKMLKRVIQKIISEFEISEQKKFKVESTMHYAFLRVCAEAYHDSSMLVCFFLWLNYPLA